MQTYECEVSNFDELADRFLAFCSSPYNGYDWTILRRNYGSYYGATVAIPVRDYEVREDYTKPIYIIESKSMHRYTRWDSVTNKNYTVDHLYNVLKKIYPNTEINCYLVDSDNGASQVISIYDNEIKPNSVIYYNFGDVATQLSLDNLKTHLDLISLMSKSKLSELHLVFGNCNTYSIDSELIRLIETYTYNYNPTKIFNFYEYLNRNLLSSNSLRYSNYDNEVYVNNNVNEEGLDKEKADTVNYYTYKLYLRYVLSEVFRIDREEYFISIMYRKITPTTYRDFLFSYNHYMSEEFNINAYLTGTRSLHSKRSNYNPFKNSGQLLAFGLHTSYDPNLWMCEQGGITCKHEEDLEINDSNLLSFYLFDGGAPLFPVNIPYYPTTGCPWFTISNDNISSYGVSSSNKIKVYFTRYRLGCTVTIRIKDNNGVKHDMWQNIVFGEFCDRKDTFNINQLYCGGGNTALCPDIWEYFPNGWIDGYAYDLDMKNSSIVNSNILYTSRFDKATFTNFRINTGDGNWRNLYQATQHFKRVNYLQGDGIPYAPVYYGVPLTKPVNYDNFTVSKLSWNNKIDNYRISSRYTKDSESSTQIDKLYAYLNW